MSSGLLEVTFVELSKGSSDVSLQVLRSFISDLNGILKNGLRNGFILWEWGRFRGNEASEVGVHVFAHDFKISLEDLEPALHEMHVLKHDPVTLFTSVVKGLDSDLFLTLTHGNVKECSLLDAYSVLSAYSFYIRSGINSGE